MGLPDFIIIGAQRSGTTWLYNILKSHKQVVLAEGRKEVHYFDRYYDRGENWYKELFPDKPSVKKGEISPAYLYQKECPSRIKKDFPEVKLICLLRNPIDRAYSGYKYMIQEKGLSISFEEAIQEFPDILERGLYFQQLKRYFEYFEKEQLGIYKFDDLIKNPDKLINSICDFLEINYEYDKNILNVQFNKSRIPSSPLLYKNVKKIIRKLYDYDKVNIIHWLKQKNIKDKFFKQVNSDNQKKGGISEDLIKELKEYYRIDINKLSDMLGIDFNALWKI